MSHFFLQYPEPVQADKLLAVEESARVEPRAAAEGLAEGAITLR